MQHKRAMAKARWVGELDQLSKLELSEGTVCGERYCTVFPGWPINWIDMELWCIAQFGPTPPNGVWTPGARWYMNNSKFWFRNEADLSWFVLRWS